LTKLNAYFKRKGYQAIVLTETAVSISTGTATFYQDPGSPVEWGASLAQGSWQKKQSGAASQATIWTLDFPALFADVVRPIIVQDEIHTGMRPPTGMKMDVEGEEEALIPAMITNGALCGLSTIVMERHPHGRSKAGKAVGLRVRKMEGMFSKLRKANSRCHVQFVHQDDKTYRMLIARCRCRCDVKRMHACMVEPGTSC
jgi:hypothetical protein